MQSKRVLFFYGLLYCVLGADTTLPLGSKESPKDNSNNRFLFYMGSGDTVFGPPTPHFFMNNPSQAIASLMFCGVVGFAGKKFYDYQIKKEREKIDKKFHQAKELYEQQMEQERQKVEKQHENVNKQLHEANELYEQQIAKEREKVNKKLHEAKESYEQQMAKDREKIEKELSKKFSAHYKELYNREWKKKMEEHQAKTNEAENAVKSNVKIYEPGSIKETFDSVAGMDSAKEDLRDICLYLDNPELFHEIGATIPKGILLSGPPGVGKTLLARSLAGEAQCSFLYVNGSQFVEMYVGRGAARVRDLFKIAHEQAPCIVFIDEIDSVASNRDSAGIGGSGIEQTQTLNQLLAEMDGFETKDDPIIVIAATNRPDCLDPAILRPGRFDKKVTVNLPGIVDRRKIIAVHLNKVVHNNIDIDVIARGTVGFSGAEIAQLVNEAALIALRLGDAAVTMAHLDESRDVILLGGKETSDTFELTREDLWKTAVHEAGHALMHVFEKDALPLYKVTIRPRGFALGITFGMYERDPIGKTQENMLAHIRVCLGGSVAEELSFKRRGSGISNDLEQARLQAKRMVMTYGMSKEYKDVSFVEYINKEFALPSDVSNALHEEITEIIHESREHVVRVLSQHIDQLHEVAHQLMEKGTLYGSEVYKICGMPEPSLEYSFVQVP